MRKRLLVSVDDASEEEGLAEESLLPETEVEAEFLTEEAGEPVALEDAPTFGMCGENLTWEVPVVTPGTSHTITFNANGGAITTASMTTGTNGKLANLPTPTRDGYTFKGWFNKASSGEQITADTIFTSDATVYAQWTTNSSGNPTDDDTNKTPGDSSDDNANKTPDNTGGNNGQTSGSNASQGETSGNKAGAQTTAPETGDPYSAAWPYLAVMAILAILVGAKQYHRKKY